MNFDLTEEQRAIRDLARDFAQREITPVIEEYEAKHQFPREIIRKLGQAGLLGCPYPEKYGGSNAGIFCQTLIIEEMTRASLGIGYAMNAQSMVGPMGIYFYGTEAQRQKYMRGLIQGELVCCFSLTEPHCGSDAVAIRTRAVRDGDDYVINGTKMWATYATVADFAIVFTKTQPELGARGATAVLIDGLERPGITRRVIPARIGSHIAPSAEMAFDNCRVPAHSRVGEEGEGFKVALGALDFGRITVAARCLGLGQAAVEAAVKYAQERVAFGQPIGQFQMVQQTIAEIAIGLEAARLMVYRAAFLADKKRPFTQEVSMAKLLAAEVAVHASDAAVELHGGYGFAEEFPLMRYREMAAVMRNVEGPANIQRQLVAQDVLGFKKASRHPFPEPRA